MSSPPPLLILFDGQCPLCCRKADFLKARDPKGALRFTDIRAQDFSPESLGIPMEQLEKQIHAILPDRTAMRGMDAIRAAYRAIGRGWLVAPTAWPLLRPFFDALYDFVAKHRLRIGRLLK